MIGNYSQSELYEMIEGNVHQKFTQVNDRQVTVNRAVRFVLGDIDLRSTKRNSQLSPNLFRDVFDYTAPTDLKQNKIVDIRKQTNRPFTDGWNMVDETDFNRFKNISSYNIALAEDDLVRILKIDGVEGAVQSILHNMDSISDNGTWAVGADASNLTVDTENKISGTASLNFDMAKGAATGYIELTGASEVNLTDHDEKSSIFVWVYIPDYADAQGDTVTNFILRWGNSDTAYWHRTVTVTNENTTFFDGWNLLRFDWNGATEVGTVDPSAIDYMRLTVTKSTSLEADTDWRVDEIISRIGEIYNVVYYSKFGWQSSSGTYLEESTATTDLLNADTNEVELIALKASELASQELKEYEDAKYFKQEYLTTKTQYEAQQPSEALRIKRVWYDAPVLRRGRGWKRTSQ